MRGLLIRLTALRQSIWFKRSGFAAIGALMGFAYYYFIGCYNGTCPISGDPYISTGYGAMMGLLLSSNGKKNEQKEGNQ